MKKITLLLSLLITSIGFSQTELLTNGDFSNGDTSWALTGGSVVNGEAAFSSTASAGNAWDTQLVQGSLTFTNAQQYTISFDARADVARNITLAIQNVGAWDDQFRQDFSLTTTMTTYTATFSAASSNGNVQIGFLMAGFGVTHGVYYDNVSLTTSAAPSCSDGIQNQDETGIDCGGSVCPACPTPPSVAAPTPTENAADVISLFSDAYTDVTSNINPGWGEVVAAETHASNDVFKTTNFVPFAISSPIDITGHNFHVDVWLPQLPSSGAGLLIKILDAANGPHEGNYTYPIANITAGQWNSIDIDINNFSQTQGTWDATAQGRVDQVLIDIVDDTTMYVDNVYFWKAPTAGLDDNAQTFVNMHPNPANGIVKFSTSSSELLSVSVYDLLGKQVIPAQTVKSELNISSLYPGVYFVKMDQGLNSITKKLLVN
ncbi:MAG: carbohydrate binding domain-containing protein [Flavobacteriaceae bacterium]